MDTSLMKHAVFFYVQTFYREKDYLNGKLILQSGCMQFIIISKKIRMLGTIDK